MEINSIGLNKVLYLWGWSY